MNDVTEKFRYMIEAIECDFVLARDDGKRLSDLDLQNEKLSKDIELLEELSYLLRYGKAKIVMTEE